MIKIDRGAKKLNNQIQKWSKFKNRSLKRSQMLGAKLK